jgi:hypothetical protein
MSRTINQNISFVDSLSSQPMRGFFHTLSFMDTGTRARFFRTEPHSQKGFSTGCANSFFQRFTVLFLVIPSALVRAKKLFFLWVGKKFFTSHQTIFKYFYSLVSHAFLQNLSFMWIISCGGNIYKRKEV